jgi:hypothetical protein
LSIDKTAIGQAKRIISSPYIIASKPLAGQGSGDSFLSTITKPEHPHKKKAMPKNKNPSSFEKTTINPIEIKLRSIG